MSLLSLKQEAEKILLKNHRNSFTLPSENIYPYQWKWDSGFIALGFAHFNLKFAISELREIYKGQWKNGFVPHILFHKSKELKHYFPGSSFYAAELSPYSNSVMQTTTLTQPPVSGWVLDRIEYLNPDSEDIKLLIKELFPRIMNEHEYLYQNRDPLNEGLVYIQHNWESGTDNSPVWDEIWNSFNVPYFDFDRKDTAFVPYDQRPHKSEYNYYLYLIELFKSLKYDDSEIAKKSPFLVQDPLFNTMLIASNDGLIRLAMKYGFEKECEKLQSWNLKSKASMNSKLFDKNNSVYRHFDLRNNKWLEGITSSSLVPLFAGVPDKRKVDDMTNIIENFSLKGKYYLCPSFDPNNLKFEHKRYWRGPVWVNMNWMISEGLKKYKKYTLSERIRKETINMVMEQGFYEYFEPDKKLSMTQKHGYGGENFSWTAALMIDYLMKK